LPELLRGTACFGRIAAQQVELKLIAVGLVEEGGHRAAEVLSS